MKRTDIAALIFFILALTMFFTVGRALYLGNFAVAWLCSFATMAAFTPAIVLFIFPRVES